MPGRTKGLPASKEITRRVKCLGSGAALEYFKLRDGYKLQGLTGKEAKDRATIELRVLERYEDWLARKKAQELLGTQVPMTPAEVARVMPEYKPPTVTQAERVGNADMSLAEQVAWAKNWSARVQNGEPAPRDFPSEGALFWFQSAISNRREFEKVVLRVESPIGEGDNAYLADGQYQMKEIEKQLKDAVSECGKRLAECEEEFAWLLKAVANDK